MSYFIRVFCPAPVAPTRREIADFISEGTFFETEAAFDPSPEASESGDADWRRFAVRYEPNKRPIILERHAADELPGDDVEELLFILHHSRQTKAQQDILQRLQSVTQVIAIEVDRENVTEECWEMLDALESFLARCCGGIVYAPDDGFFDTKLRRIYRL